MKTSNKKKERHLTRTKLNRRAKDRPGACIRFMDVAGVDDASSPSFLGLNFPSPVPMEFLQDIFNSNEVLIRSMLRVFAYAINGLTCEEIIVFLVGGGGEFATCLGTLSLEKVCVKA
jgi:phage/plasmid-associated DNA primase